MDQEPLSSSRWLNSMFIACFAMLSVFALVLVQIGVPITSIAVVMLALVVGCYIFAGLYGRTLLFDRFHFAERTANPYALGQTIAAGTISSAVYLFLAGDIFHHGTSALSFFWGWLLGIALLGLLFSAKLARLRTATISEAVTHRGSSSALLTFLISLVVITCCGCMFLAQLSFIGFVGEGFFGIDSQVAIYMMLLCIFWCLVLGGIQSVSIARVSAYPLILICFLIPLVWITASQSAYLFPFFSYGVSALDQVREIDMQLVDAGLQTKDEIFDFTQHAKGMNTFSYFAILLTLAFGTASMPHLLQQISTTGKPAIARNGTVWAFGLLLVFVAMVPSVAAFVKLNLYNILLGLPLADFEDEASWLFALSGDGAIPFIKICGQLVSSFDEVLASCGQDRTYFLTQKDFSIDPQFLVLSLPSLHGLPAVISAIAAVGALLALMTTADGLLFSMATAMSVDGYRRLLRPMASKGIQLFTTRLMLLVLVVGLGAISAQIDYDPVFLFQLAIALGSTVLFPALLAVLWFKDIRQIQLLVSLAVGLACLVVPLALDFTGNKYLYQMGLDLLTSPDSAHVVFCYGLVSTTMTFATMVLTDGAYKSYRWWSGSRIGNNAKSEEAEQV